MCSVMLKVVSDSPPTGRPAKDHGPVCEVVGVGRPAPQGTTGLCIDSCSDFFKFMVSLSLMS